MVKKEFNPLDVLSRLEAKARIENKEGDLMNEKSELGGVEKSHTDPTEKDIFQEVAEEPVSEPASEPSIPEGNDSVTSEPEETQPSAGKIESYKEMTLKLLKKEYEYIKTQRRSRYKSYLEARDLGMAVRKLIKEKKEGK